MTNVETNKVLSGLALLLSGFGTLKYLVFGHRILNDDPFDIGITPFTGNTLMVVIFWIIMYLLQIAFWLKYIVMDSNGTNFFSGDCRVANHFMTFNFFNFLWAFSFSRHWFVLSELCVIINLVQLTFSLFVNKASKYSERIKDLLLIHGATGALPYLWTIYLLFWNGAAMFGVQKNLFARIIANIMIWNMLFIPLMYVSLDSDWMMGLAGSYLLFAIGLGQLFTKLFALQWIFAFIISGLLLVASLVTIFTDSRRNASPDQEPLIA